MEFLRLRELVLFVFFDEKKKSRARVGGWVDRFECFWWSLLRPNIFPCQWWEFQQHQRGVFRSSPLCLVVLFFVGYIRRLCLFKRVWDGGRGLTRDILKKGEGGGGFDEKQKLCSNPIPVPNSGETGGGGSASILGH